jgi:hypothetical protein
MQPLAEFVHENDPGTVIFRSYDIPRPNDLVSWVSRLGGTPVEYKCESVKWKYVSPKPFAGEPGATHCRCVRFVTVADVP